MANFGAGLVAQGAPRGAPERLWPEGNLGAFAAPGTRSKEMEGRESPAAESAALAPAGPGEPGRGGAGARVRGRSGGDGC